MNHDICVCLVGRVFTYGLGDQSSNPSRVILKTQKMVFDISLLNIQHYEVHVKGKNGAIQGKE